MKSKIQGWAERSEAHLARPTYEVGASGSEASPIRQNRSRETWSKVVLVLVLVLVAVVVIVVVQMFDYDYENDNGRENDNDIEISSTVCSICGVGD